MGGPDLVPGRAARCWWWRAVLGAGGSAHPGVHKAPFERCTERPLIPHRPSSPELSPAQPSGISALLTPQGGGSSGSGGLHPQEGDGCSAIAPGCPQPGISRDFQLLAVLVLPLAQKQGLATSRSTSCPVMVTPAKAPAPGPWGGRGVGVGRLVAPGGTRRAPLAARPAARPAPQAQCRGPAPEPGAEAPFPAPSAFVSPL